MADTLHPLPGGEPQAATPGRRLCEARQAQNLAAADIARQLKLSVWQVEALEEGRYQQLPGPIFVRGFIRNYARLVKLDGEELLRAAGDSLPQQAARPEVPPSADIPFPTAQPPVWHRYVVATVVIVGALAVYEFGWNDIGRMETQAVAVTPVPVTPEPVVVAVESPAQPAVELRPVEPSVFPAPAPDAVSGAPAAAVPEPQRATRPGEKQVRLEFVEESWVEIRDRDDRVIFSQLNAPGTARQVSGMPPLSIVVGNSHGVRMTYDDRRIDLASHTKIDVARLTLQ